MGRSVQVAGTLMMRMRDRVFIVSSLPMDAAATQGRGFQQSPIDESLILPGTFQMKL
jgi:hypothetical protein